MEKRSWIVYAICATSLLMIAVALVNAWLAFGYLMFLNLSLWLLLGAMRQNQIRTAAILAIASFVVWALCFSAIVYYWGSFYGRFPEFTVAGMHPGFFVLFPLMWLLGFVVVTVSYALLFEKIVISEDDWKEFLKKIGKGEVRE